MKILAIETSCDETAIAIVKVEKTGDKTKFKILGNEVSSQIALHAQYGGVFPMMAKREHGKNIVYILEKVLKEAKMRNFQNKNYKLDQNKKKQILQILEREKELSQIFEEKVFDLKKPKIDAIAVTTGPGLEPTLWVGISFAKALSTLWNIPVIPVNHMEGHIFSIFPKKSKNFTINLKEKIFPILSLLVSGGHTELVLIKNWNKYKKIGQTRDDAVGEAFDKVARMLSLPYPGGPEIGRLASIERSKELFKFLGPRTRGAEAVPDHKNLNNSFPPITLPRPMINSKDYDFSFSGLKTAVLYLIRDIGELTDEVKSKIAREFENAVVETLVHKTIRAIKEYEIKTLIVGGGVSANTYLQKVMIEEIKKNNHAFSADKLKTKVYFPNKNLTGDNALMIAISGYFQYQNKKYTKKIKSIKANGNLSL